MFEDSLPVIGEDTLEANLPRHARQQYKLVLRHHEQCHSVVGHTTLVEEYHTFLNSTMPKLDIVERERILKAQNEALFKKVIEQERKEKEAQRQRELEAKEAQRKLDEAREMAMLERDKYVALLEKRANIRK